MGFSTLWAPEQPAWRLWMLLSPLQAQPVFRGGEESLCPSLLVFWGTTCQVL